MTAITVETPIEPDPNPIDLVEQIAGAHDWLFDRRSADELAGEPDGKAELVRGERVYRGND